MSQEKFQDYFRSQQVSPQWLLFCRSLAAELGDSADRDDLQELFFNIGTRCAKESEHLFQGVQTLQQLQALLNEYWARLDWGWTELAEQPEYLQISHCAAPLAEAFGDETLSWTVSYLEGFYQTVFTVLGASERMTVCRLDEPTDGMVIQLRFGRA